jgi:TP901-1 family phage major tail protein
MAFNGTDFLILVNTGTPSVPVYTAVGSQRGATIDETTEVIDYSSKDKRHRRVGPGRYSTSLSFDGLYVPSDASFAALNDAMRNGTTILVAREEEDSVLETATAVVATLNSDFPDQAESTISVTLEIDDEWTVVGS